MSIIDHLTELFSKFPGIGLRQARRFVYFLMYQDQQTVDDFITSINRLRSQVRQCRRCFRFFQILNGANSPDCLSCSDSHTDRTMLLIVEKDTDAECMEKSGMYSGTYFVLGGTLSPLKEKGEKVIRTRVKTLLYEVKRRANEEGFLEIIIGLSADPAGEYTVQELKKLLDPICSKNDVKISVLGKGLSTGAEIEYLDDATLKNALTNRK